jgi:hypothetical protein
MSIVIYLWTSGVFRMREFYFVSCWIWYWTKCKPFVPDLGILKWDKQPALPSHVLGSQKGFPRIVRMTFLRVFFFYVSCCVSCLCHMAGWYRISNQVWSINFNHVNWAHRANMSALPLFECSSNAHTKQALYLCFCDETQENVSWNRCRILLMSCFE